jgi:hypothetical protein
MLQLVDFEICSDNALSERNVTPDQGIDGINDLTFGKATHLGHKPVELLKIVIERLGGMF